jgi:hypothetical protein
MGKNLQQLGTHSELITDEMKFGNVFIRSRVDKLERLGWEFLRFVQSSEHGKLQRGRLALMTNYIYLARLSMRLENNI